MKKIYVAGLCDRYSFSGFQPKVLKRTVTLIRSTCANTGNLKRGVEKEERSERREGLMRTYRHFLKNNYNYCFIPLCCGVFIQF